MEAWAYVDSPGYDEAVTYIRNHAYILATPDALTKIKDDRDYDVANGGKLGNYAGITAMPDGGVVVSDFSVPAGLYHGSPDTCHQIGRTATQPLASRNTTHNPIEAALASLTQGSSVTFRHIDDKPSRMI
jgi:hypothetical protein